MKSKCILFVLLLAFLPLEEVEAQDQFLGEIRMFAGNFAPRGWAFCDGQLLSIARNSALFSILGTTYGGDGRTTFALPDLRGRSPIHAGAGSGLSRYNLGQKGGSESIQTRTINVPSSASRGTMEIKVPVEDIFINNQPPYLTVHYIIAIQGIFPSRN